MDAVLRSWLASLGTSSFNRSPGKVGGTGCSRPSAVVFVVAFIGIAVVKPWGSTATPPRTPVPPGTPATQRLVAVCGGCDPRVWVSSEGRSWREIPASGVIPSEHAKQATPLPGGVILTNGSTT